MLAFLMSLATILVPLGASSGPQPAPFEWLDGIWRTDSLELTCGGSAAGTRCREEGRTAAMKGASADLAIMPLGEQAGSQLKVTLPGIPASTFREIERGAQSVTYEMPTKIGIARLRFTRKGDVLKLERGNDKAWATTMTYQKG